MAVERIWKMADFKHFVHAANATTASQFSLGSGMIICKQSFIYGFYPRGLQVSLVEYSKHLKETEITVHLSVSSKQHRGCWQSGGEKSGLLWSTKLVCSYVNKEGW